MADMSKAEKLAAARKKLKEYQQKPKDSNKTFANIKNVHQNNGQESRNGKESLLQTSFNRGEPPPITLREPYQRPDEQVTEVYNATPRPPSHYLNSSNTNIQHPIPSTLDPFARNQAVNEDLNSVNGITMFGHASTEPQPTPAQPVTNDFFDNFPTQNTDWHANQSTFSTSFSFNPVQSAPISSDFSTPLDLTKTLESSSGEYSTFQNPSSSIEPFDYLNHKLTHASPENLSEDINFTSTEPHSLILKPQTPELNISTDAQSTQLSDVHKELETEHNASYTTERLPELTIPEIQPFAPEQQYTMGFVIPEKFTDVTEELNSALESTFLNTWNTEQPNPLMPASSVLPTTTDEPAREDINVTVSDVVESLPTKLEHATLVTQQAPVSPRSTAENIRQLSMHMNGLIRESSQSPINAERNELESRNQELAALLDLERQRSEQLQQHLQEYESRLTQTLAETEAARAAGEAEGRREVASLQEQLQLHAQTLGILVAEKTELQAALAQFQAAAKQKVSDAEELKSRLNASRHRVGDLEKELNALRSSTDQNETVRQTLTIEFEQLKREQALVTLRLQETLEEREDINHRLATKAAECSTIGQELLETKTQLSLAQLRVEQLSSHTSPEDTSHLETLYQDKINLEHKVADLELKLSSVEATEEEKYKQYQLYVKNMDEQLRGLTECNERLAAENRQLVQREDSLVLHVTGLERRLQDAMRPQPAPERAEPSAEVEGKVKELEAEKKRLDEEVEAKIESNKALEATLRERDIRIEELESFLDRLQGDQPDQARLLAAMESDKVAASRAVSQNQFLKQELEEIQNKNIQLSDGLFDITDKLQHERHVSRELTQRLAEQETWINTLNEELAARPKQNTPAEGGHHYDDHGQIADILHRELAQTKDRVEALTQQNAELRGLLAQVPTKTADGVDDRDERIRQLTAERDALLTGRSVEEGTEPPASRYAMEQLQERFTSTMREVAELSDEKQRLEHLVLQLQGETETIGEYITLYQKQRSLLRERADEKDTQLKCLAQDREEMRGKLAQLNELIRRLVAERGAASVDGVLSDLADIAGDTQEEPPNQVEVATDAAEAPTPKADTADEIMALLTEIGSSNLIDPQQLVEHFHPCGWCSGRLITV